MNRRIILSPQVEAFVRQLAPEPRTQARRALEGLVSDRGDIRPLEEDLEGYQRLRVGKYRIIFRYTPDEIRCSFMETRASVYQLFTQARDLIDPL